ncbi:MAG TPA: thiolase domain-containing protein [Candidatus Woesebacteria bacterium]|nr:thiolase domain-containing protein [Candidatus Woesebacteria bacterium]HPR99393.1 thiolase domain-containing protein [Candidatus Woesebacteria bacterium]
MKIAVVGAYQTKFGELWEKSLSDLIAETIFETVKNSHLDLSQVQAIYIGNMLSSLTSDQNHLTSMVSEITGLNIPVIRVEAACASGGLAVLEACQGIESGLYGNALVIGAEKMTDLSSDAIAQALMSAASEEERNCGLTFPGLYAIMAKKYFSEFGADEEDLAFVSVKNHFHASLNDRAHLPFEINIKQVMESTSVADPLKLLDCSPVSDGAAGVFLSSPKFAQKYAPDTKIFITASAIATDTLNLSKRDNLTGLKATQIASKQAYEQAGIKSRDINLAEVHDCFSIAEIMAVEDLGFCKKGEAVLFETSGTTKLGGKLPINLSGGLKACGHPIGATGVKQIVELFNQLNHTCGPRQTPLANIGLAQNIGGTGGTAVIHILQKLP